MIRFLLYGLFGWCVEIVWTACYAAVAAVLAGRRPDPRLTGHTYLWMLPIYGGGGLLFEAVFRAIHWYPWPVRGAIYVLGCFTVEYAAGRAIERLSGTIPWDYTASRWNVHGLIRLDYAPAWFAFGFLLERVSVAVRTVEQALQAG